MTPKYIKTLNHQRIADLLSQFLPSKGNQTNTSPAYSDREFQAIISRAISLLNQGDSSADNRTKVEYGITWRIPKCRKWQGPYIASSKTAAKKSIALYKASLPPFCKFKAVKRTISEWTEIESL